MKFPFIQENPLENVVWKMAATMSRPQCVKNNKSFGMYCKTVACIVRQRTHCNEECNHETPLYSSLQ